MLYALTLPLVLLAIFKLPVLRDVQPSRSWRHHRQTYCYLLRAAFVVFSFRLIPYWIFNDKILHFLGGGLAIALVYEYLVINYDLSQGNGIFNLKFAYEESRSTHLLANMSLVINSIQADSIPGSISWQTSAARFWDISSSGFISMEEKI